MAWRPAYSLETLKAQLDATYPGWLFLGYLGDAAHADKPSDHNPNSAGVVTALDIGPGGGLSIHSLADNLAASPHPDCKYIISNYRIAEWQNGFKWQPYSGSDPHDTHIHISVGRGPDGQSTQPYDDRVQWNIKGEDMTVDDALARRLYTLSTLMAQNGNAPDRQPTTKEITDAIGRDAVAFCDYLINTAPWGDNWNKVKHYTEDVANAGSGDSTVLKPGKYLVK